MLPTNREPTKPGTILKFYLEDLKITQTRLAEHLGWPQPKVNEIIRGKRGITPEAAVALADALGTTPDMWLNAQKNWELWQALQVYQPKGQLLSAS